MGTLRFFLPFLGPLLLRLLLLLAPMLLLLAGNGGNKSRDNFGETMGKCERTCSIFGHGKKEEDALGKKTVVIGSKAGVPYLN